MVIFMGLSISLWRAHHPPSDIHLDKDTFWGKAKVSFDTISASLNQVVLSLSTTPSRSLSNCVCVCVLKPVIFVSDSLMCSETHTQNTYAFGCSLTHKPHPHSPNRPSRIEPKYARSITTEPPYHREDPCRCDCTALILLKCHFDWLWCVWMGE